MLPDLTTVLPLPWLQFWAAMERIVVLCAAGFLVGYYGAKWRWR